MPSSSTITISRSPVPAKLALTTAPEAAEPESNEVEQATAYAIDLMERLESAMHRVRKLSRGRYGYMLHRRYGSFAVTLMWQREKKYRISFSAGNSMKSVGFREITSGNPHIKARALELVAENEDRILGAIERLERELEKRSERREKSDAKGHDKLVAAAKQLLETE